MKPNYLPRNSKIEINISRMFIEMRTFKPQLNATLLITNSFN